MTFSSIDQRRPSSSSTTTFDTDNSIDWLLDPYSPSRQLEPSLVDPPSANPPWLEGLLSTIGNAHSANVAGDDLLDWMTQSSKGDGAQGWSGANGMGQNTGGPSSQAMTNPLQMTFPFLQTPSTLQPDLFQTPVQINPPQTPAPKPKCFCDVTDALNTLRSYLRRQSATGSPLDNLSGILDDALAATQLVSDAFERSSSCLACQNDTSTTFTATTISSLVLQIHETCIHHPTPGYGFMESNCINSSHRAGRSFNGYHCTLVEAIRNDRRI